MVSPYFVERIAQLLHDPAFDPHGDPIPDRDLNLSDSRTLTLLAELHPGERGVVRLITNQNADLLIYLRGIGIYPGAELQLIQQNPIDGTQQVAQPETGQAPGAGKATCESIQVERSRPEARALSSIKTGRISFFANVPSPAALFHHGRPAPLGVAVKKL